MFIVPVLTQTHMHAHTQGISNPLFRNKYMLSIVRNNKKDKVCSSNLIYLHDIPYFSCYFIIWVISYTKALQGCVERTEKREEKVLSEN